MSTDFDEIYDKMQEGASKLRSELGTECESLSEVSESLKLTTVMESGNQSTSQLEKERFQHLLKKVTGRVIKTGDVVNTFVQGNIFHEPIENISKARFTEEIHNNLFRKGYRAVFPIQAYSWNEICDGRSVTIINSKCSGKTMGNNIKYFRLCD